MQAQKPDIEIRRKLKNGGYRSLVIIYWKPLKVWVLGRNIYENKIH